MLYFCFSFLFYSKKVISNIAFFYFLLHQQKIILFKARFKHYRHHIILPNWQKSFIYHSPPPPQKKITTASTSTTIATIRIAFYISNNFAHNTSYFPLLLSSYCAMWLSHHKVSSSVCTSNCLVRSLALLCVQRWATHKARRSLPPNKSLVT